MLLSIHYMTASNKNFCFFQTFLITFCLIFSDKLFTLMLTASCIEMLISLWYFIPVKQNTPKLIGLKQERCHYTLGCTSLVWTHLSDFSSVYLSWVPITGTKHPIFTIWSRKGFYLFVWLVGFCSAVGQPQGLCLLELYPKTIFLPFLKRGYKD